MPRKPRIEYAGAIYHVMSRGDRGDPIVKDNEDRERFVRSLANVCKRTGWIIHAYVLMDNHYHLLVETPEANLVAGMKWFQGTYTIRYNVRHGEHGHLFQGRYKALIIDPEKSTYLRRVSTYIHLNPMRAGKVQAGFGGLKKYQWCSYPMYLEQKGKSPEWLQTERVMGSCGINPDSIWARRQYESYLKAFCRKITTGKGRKELEAEWNDVRRGWCLGGSDFKDQMLKRVGGVLKGREKTSYCGEEIKTHDKVAAERKLEKCLKACNIGEEQLRKMPKGDNVKRVIAWALKKQTTVSNKWLSERLRLGHPSNVPGYARSVDYAEAGSVFHLRKKLDEILKSED